MSRALDRLWISEDVRTSELYPSSQPRRRSTASRCQQPISFIHDSVSAIWQYSGVLMAGYPRIVEAGRSHHLTLITNEKENGKWLRVIHVQSQTKLFLSSFLFDTPPAATPEAASQIAVTSTYGTSVRSSDFCGW